MSLFSWSIVSNTLPAGLVLSTNTGAISGTPAVAGSFIVHFRATGSNNVAAGGNYLLTIAPAEAGLTATQSMSLGYVSPGTNALACQVSYPAGRQLYLLHWQPALPTGWALVSAQGDGSPEVKDGQVVFTAAKLPNPLNFTCAVGIPAGQPGTNALGGSVSYYMNGMNDLTTVSATPNPLLVSPAKRHSADYQDPPWNIDGLEISWVLAYWRGQGYHVASNGRDDYALGTGNTNGALHSADFEVPFWTIDGTEVNRVLAYWRAGAYHPEPTGVDGYAPGMMGVAAAPSPAMARLLSANEASVTQSVPACYPPGTTVAITNEIEYRGTILSLLLRPNLPEGWTLRSVTGPGTPQAVAGEIVWVGAIPASPFSLVYAVQVPTSGSAATLASAQLKYQFAGMVNPLSALAILDTNQPPTVRITTPVVSGAEISFDVIGEPGRNYHIQASTNLVDWSDIMTLTATNGRAHMVDTMTRAVRFYRAMLK